MADPEDLIRNRLVALADTYTDGHAVTSESSRRRMNRFRSLLAEGR